jgi:hypothetical protein
MPNVLSKQVVARIGFAGLFPICEKVLREPLKSRQDIELIEPWTQLPSLHDDSMPGISELLFVQMDDDELPQALRVLLAAAEPLRIVGLSANARKATIFSIHDRKTVMLGYGPGRLWESMARTL